jgi:8-oxo-dGTP pyrophosphatase MutT (NUDIX family)
MTLPFTRLIARSYPVDAIKVAWSSDPFEPPQAVTDQIEAAWESAQHDAAMHGRDLFPGAMTRLNDWSADAHALHLNLGPTDYRAFVGTNLRHPEFAERYGPAALANPLGISIAVITADNQIVVQKRSEHVFELPGYYHVGGGNVEPVDVAGPNAPGIAATVRRELEEELAIAPDQITEQLCLGLAENAHVRKPDLLIATHVSLPAGALATRQNAEYSALVCLADEPTLTCFLRDNARTTSPGGIACLLALGHHRYGPDWAESLVVTLEDVFRNDAI